MSMRRAEVFQNVEQRLHCREPVGAGERRVLKGMAGACVLKVRGSGLNKGEAEPK